MLPLDFLEPTLYRQCVCLPASDAVVPKDALVSGPVSGEVHGADGGSSGRKPEGPESEPAGARRAQAGGHRHIA
jgi:hypothetical protein